MKKKIPKFKNEDEEREFWSKHDSTGYVDWRSAKRVTLPDLKPNRLPSVAELSTIVSNSTTFGEASAMVPFTLKYLFSSKLRVKVLSRFFSRPGETFYVRQLAVALDESAGTVARELKGLEKAGLLSSKPVGNQKHYSQNEDSPILPDLRNIFLKTTGAGAQLRKVLEKTSGVELAFIFGSYTGGEAHAGSDIDLMVIGDVSDRQLAPAVSRIERRLKRQINYTLYTRREAEKRSNKKGDFIHEVLSGSRIMITGKENDRLFRVD